MEHQNCCTDLRHPELLAACPYSSVQGKLVVQYPSRTKKVGKLPPLRSFSFLTLRVTGFAPDVKACALGHASSSIMARHVVGSTASELRELRETVRKMLKKNGSPPQGKWAEVALLEPVRDFKARHASTMLTFDAVVDAIGQIEARTRQPVSAQG
jgi:hypothetical protein